MTRALTKMLHPQSQLAPELLSDEALRGDVSEVSYSQAVDVYVRLFRYFFFVLVLHL